MFGASAPQALQMFHRVAAGAFALGTFSAALFATRIGQRRTAFAAWAASLLVIIQAMLGAANIAAGLPTALREAHAANAAACFVMLMIAASLAVIEPQRTAAIATRVRRLLRPRTALSPESTL